MRELTIKVHADKVTEEQIDRIDKLLMSEFKPENIVILEEEYIEESKNLNFYLIDNKIYLV